MGTYLSFYFYFFLKAKTQISALVEFTESFLQYPLLKIPSKIYLAIINSKFALFKEWINILLFIPLNFTSLFLA